MDWDRVTGLILVFVKEVCHLLDWFIMTSVGASKNDVNTNCVFVDELHGLFRIEPVFALNADWNESAFDLEVASEFLEGNLSIGAHNDIGARFMNGLASSLATFLPDAFHGKTSQLDGFGGACGGGTDRLFSGGCMPKIGEDRDASGVDKL